MSLQKEWHFLRHFHSIHWSLGIFQAHLEPADLYIRTTFAVTPFSCVHRDWGFSENHTLWRGICMHAYATVCTEICNIQYIPGVKHKDCNISKVVVRSQGKPNRMCFNAMGILAKSHSRPKAVRPFDITIKSFHFRSKHFSKRQKASCLMISTWFQSTVFIYIDNHYSITTSSNKSITYAIKTSSKKDNFSSNFTPFSTNLKTLVHNWKTPQKNTHWHDIFCVKWWTRSLSSWFLYMKYSHSSQPRHVQSSWPFARDPMLK